MKDIDKVKLFLNKEVSNKTDEILVNKMKELESQIETDSSELNIVLSKIKELSSKESELRKIIFANSQKLSAYYEVAIESVDIDNEDGNVKNEG